MTILDRIKSMWSNSAVIKAASPQASTYDVQSMQGGFQQSIVNGGPSPLWANYRPVYSGYGFNPYSADRDRYAAAVVTNDMAERVPTLATIIDSAINSMIGCGLTLSSKPSAVRLGITEDEARTLAHDIERAWIQWCEDPAECDFAGRHDLHSLVTAMAYTYLRSGEGVALLEWAKVAGARTRTKVRVLDPSQIDTAKSTTDAASRTYNGVTFDLRGRWAGCWIRPHNLGDNVHAATSRFIPARTPWGRPYIIHVGELRDPNQTRYRTPLMAALNPVKGRETAAEFVLTGFNLQNQYAVSIKSNVPASVALAKLEGPDLLVPRTPGAPGSPANVATFDPAALAVRREFYKDVRIGASPGTVTPLLPGDELDMNRAESPHDNYDTLDKSLARQAARAAGEAAEIVTGDFSDTSYSASKLAIVPAHRTAMRRRRQVVARIYSMVFDAWLEEQIETGAIQNPSKVPYWRDRKAFNAAKWRGDGMIVADRHKEVVSDLLEIQNGLATHESALAARGYDLEDVLEQRVYEKTLFEKYGLPWPGAGVVNTQIRITDDGDEPAPSKRARK